MRICAAAGRWLTANMLVGIGGRQVHVTITGGQITGIDSGPGLMRPWRFAVRGTNHAWGRVLAPGAGGRMARPLCAQQAR